MAKPIFQDQIYAAPRSQVEDFVFDEKVASVFGEMLDRSVPGYRDIVHMMGVLSERYAQPKSHIYDMGCSLGAVTLMMRQFLGEKNCKIIAVDNSPAMIKKFKENLKLQASEIKVEAKCEDILKTEISRASFVVFNLTLQFIPIEYRAELLKKVYDSMLPGGALVITEKIAFEDARENQFQMELHHTFKKLHGYSDLEISQKRTALENVLIPETLKAHEERLVQIGFSKPTPWFQCFNFASFLAFKP